MKVRGVVAIEQAIVELQIYYVDAENVQKICSMKFNKVLRIIEFLPHRM